MTNTDTKVIVKNGNQKSIIITEQEKKEIVNCINSALEFMSVNDLYLRKLENIKNKFK